MTSPLPPLLLLLVAALGGVLAAPVETPVTENPFLEGLDDFLSAFDGLALSGDPLAETPVTETNEPHEPEAVTEVAPCLGCVHELESDSAEMRGLAQLASQLLEEELNMTRLTEVTQVYRAAHQVVNGIKYYLTLELSQTNCSRPLEAEDLVCLTDPETEPLLYAVELLQPPQEELGTQLLDFSEVPAEEVLHLPGLFDGSASPPTSPPAPADPVPAAPAPADEPSGIVGIEGDLLAMISDMQRFQEAESYGPQDDPATALRHMRRYGIGW